MIEFMEQHDALTKNSLQCVSNGREKKKKLWSKLTEMLNSNGPPMKSTKGWQKVWTDYKYNAKRKLSARMNSLKKTGGGPYDAVKLSNLEERVIAAANINAQVMGIPGVASYGTKTDEPCSSTAAPEPDEAFVSDSLREMLSESSSNNENEGAGETNTPRGKRSADTASDREAPPSPKAPQTSKLKQTPIVPQTPKKRCVDPKIRIIEQK
ncbi:myb-related transcription factor, partner of profilin-like [Rhagoletis pomonella]|uniref:myb-related transcription factor, partner of profilin-like n=1 Tax=Rhagoletis pomonella TaxID=28610 RepID=UPI00177C6144|nr:myb-related transcription factor, partner of profilin-like [Rhagoletis pomonella]